MSRIERINIEMAKKHSLIEDNDTVSYEEAMEAIKNPDSFANRIKASKTEVSPNVWLNEKTVELDGDNFINMYDLSFSNTDSKLETKIITRKTPLHQHRLFVNEAAKGAEEGKPVACINGAFFFLQHGKLEKYPSEIIYNLNIRDGKVIGLPAVTRPGLFVTKDGHVHAKELKSSGLVRIGNTEINWIGGEPISHNKPEKGNIENASAILFNSACSTIEYQDMNDKTSLKILNEKLNHTPKRHGVTDIVVKAEENGKLIVTALNSGGGTDFFDGNFILQVNNNLATGIKTRDEVMPETLDDLNLKDIKSALTTGPLVKHFLKNDDHEINHDPSLGTFPPFIKDRRYGRSIMYEDKKSQIHMVVFDGVPRSQHMKGATPKEVAENIPSDVKWAVFLDGGQSSRITFENHGEIDSRGNQQYLRLPKVKDGETAHSPERDSRFLWTRKGRALSSMIALYRKR